MPLSANQRSLRARIAALHLHATGGTTTTAARAAFRDSFETLVDPDGTLEPEERARRAEFARREHFTRLALRSSQARAASKSKNAAMGSTPNAALEVSDDEPVDDLVCAG